MFYVGIDHHKRYCQLAAVDEQGAVVKERGVPTEREPLVRFFEELAFPCAVTLEAGRNWGLIYDWLEEAVEELKLAHPLKTKAIAWAKIKTDRIDARILAQLLRANLVPTAHIPGLKTRPLRSLLRRGTRGPTL